MRKANQTSRQEMYIHIHPYALLAILSGIISLVASIITWRRSAPGSRMLSLALFSAALWSVFYSPYWMNLPLENRVFWFNIMYIGVATLPTLFLLFAIEFTHNKIWLTRRHLFLLAIVPVISILLHWTNNYHHLIYLGMETIVVRGFVTIEYTRGAWYYVSVVYSYGVIGIALFLLSQRVLHSSPLYLSQYRLVLIASLLPWLSSIYSELRFNNLAGLDLAPLTMGFSGIIIAFSTLQQRFMDLIPVARSHLIENMSDGILVLDAQNRVVDINPAMENFLDKNPLSYMGRNASEIFDGWLKESDLRWEEIETRTELKVPKDPTRYLDLRVTPLYDRDQFVSGRIMVFRDVTDRKQVEKRLRAVNERLQNQLIEIGYLQSQLREQAIRDPLTNLFNRRYLEETLDHELARAAREDYQVCIEMIDLDHFKRVNDTYGHEAGDYLLKAIAHTLSQEARRGDFICRYGGEEFVVVMPNINRGIAYQRARELRRTLNSLRVPYGVYELTTTISMGIACYPKDGKSRDSILRAADRAMYGAKEAGRNHILAYDELPI